MLNYLRCCNFDSGQWNGKIKFFLVSTGAGTIHVHVSLESVDKLSISEKN